MRYQTEIHVAGDRYVCLQLPSFFPEGTATVTVTVEVGQGRGDETPVPEADDRHDVEWWDEFDEDHGRSG